MKEKWFTILVWTNKKIVVKYVQADNQDVVAGLAQMMAGKGQYQDYWQVLEGHIEVRFRP